MIFEEKMQISDENLFNNLLHQLHKRYDYPLYLLKSCMKSKCLLLLQFEGAIYEWEKELIEEHNIYFLRPVKVAFDKIARRLFIPALRQYYSAPIDQIYFTERYFRTEKRSGYAVVLFNNSIFGRDKSSILKGLEDILSNRLAKSMRNLTGRGPKAIKTVVFDSNTCVHIVKGFLSAYEQSHMAKAAPFSLDIVSYAGGHLMGNRSYINSVDDVGQSFLSPVDIITYSSFENVIKEILYSSYSYIEQNSLQFYIELDVKQNQMCVLVLGHEITAIPDKSF